MFHAEMDWRSRASVARGSSLDEVERLRGMVFASVLGTGPGRVAGSAEYADALVILERVERVQTAQKKYPLSLPGTIPVSPPRWIVKGLIEEGSLAVFFGDPGAGKSFLSLDLACSIATRTLFHDRPVKKAGPVFYLAGEGFSGIQRRIAAWALSHGKRLDQIPVAVSRMPASLCYTEAMAIVADSLDGWAAELGTPSVIIIDTWSRSLAGDENSSLDAAVGVQALDTLRGRFPGAACLVVHHSGQADKSRARGSSVLRAACDLEVAVTKNAEGIITASCTKSKDAIPFSPLYFSLTDVGLGFVDDEGQEVSSAVLMKSEKPEEHTKPVQGKHQTQMMIILEELLSRVRKNDPDREPKTTVSVWRKECATKGVPRQRIYEAILALQKAGRIRVIDDCVSIL